MLLEPLADLHKIACRTLLTQIVTMQLCMIYPQQLCSQKFYHITKPKQACAQSFCPPSDANKFDHTSDSAITNCSPLYVAICFAYGLPLTCTIVAMCWSQSLPLDYGSCMACLQAPLAKPGSCVLEKFPNRLEAGVSHWLRFRGSPSPRRHRSIVAQATYRGYLGDTRFRTHPRYSNAAIDQAKEDHREHMRTVSLIRGHLLAPASRKTAFAQSLGCLLDF